MLNAHTQKITGKASAVSFYQPLLLGINVFYVILRWFLLGSTVTLRTVVVLTVLASLQWYAYVGIVDHASSRKKANDTSLVGGSSLDLLAVVLSIQFGALLLTPKFYYLLALLPVWAAHSLYSAFFGTAKKAKPTYSAFEDSNAAERQQRANRAERRRKK